MPAKPGPFDQGRQAAGRDDGPAHRTARLQAPCSRPVLIFRDADSRAVSPVIEEAKPVRILTDRDVALAPGRLRERLPGPSPVGASFMSKGVITVAPATDPSTGVLEQFGDHSRGACCWSSTPSGSPWSASWPGPTLPLRLRRPGRRVVSDGVERTEAIGRPRPHVPSPGGLSRTPRPRGGGPRTRSALRTDGETVDRSPGRDLPSRLTRFPRGSVLRAARLGVGGRRARPGRGGWQRGAGRPVRRKLPAGCRRGRRVVDQKVHVVEAVLLPWDEHFHPP